MSKSETETIITWTAEDEEATVYSLMPKVWRWCQSAGGREIEIGGGIRQGKKVARTYLVPVSAIRVRRKKVLSESARERLREQGQRLAALRKEVL